MQSWTSYNAAFFLAVARAGELASGADLQFRHHYITRTMPVTEQLVGDYGLTALVDPDRDGNGGAMHADLLENLPNQTAQKASREAEPAATRGDAFDLPRLWQYSAPLIAPEVRNSNPSRAQKDPSVVFYAGKWHLFMTVKLPGKSAIEYCSFTRWEEASASPRAILKVSDSDCYCAPQVFYFRPQQQRYPVYQMGVPGLDQMWAAYSTTADIAAPHTWKNIRPLPRPLPSWLTLAWLACLAYGLPPLIAQEAPDTIESGRYNDDAAARAAWQPMTGTAPVSAALDGKAALRFPCDFTSTRIERASWDRQVRLDLSGCRGVQFEFFCRDASPVSHFSLYFQSGAGWYATTFYPESSGWNRITIGTSSMSSEGEPAGWAAVRTVRLSAWRGSEATTEFFLRDFRKVGVLGPDTLIGLVRCDSAIRASPAEAGSAQQSCAAVADQLTELGLEYATISDLDMTIERLRHPKLIVLPHNPVMPAEAVETLVQFLNQGGRLLAFYGLPTGLRSVVKIDAGPFVRPARPGGFAAMRFLDGALPGAPSVVGQTSWNIREPKPVSGASRRIAEWLDAQGQPTGHAAVVASSNAVEMSHVLLGDDASNKRQMLLAMAGYLVPQVWRQATDAALARLGRLAGCQDFDDAAARITQMAGQDPAVASQLGAARRLRDEAVTHRAAGRYPDACARASEAAERLLNAFASAQRPLANEFRAFWCHSAFGVEGMDWDSAIRRLAENGFTAILPNLLWGGVAFYPSAVLPVAPEVATRGDQLEQCLAACRHHGLQIHVWKVNWNLGAAPKDFVEQMRREGRLQAGADGESERWLCPSHPANQKLEVASMLEIVRRYPVDGIHFDYIRYPDDAHCFCAGCRDRFTQLVGARSLRWPEDVRPGGAHRQAWLNWRRANITAVVQTVSEQARAIRPTIRLSAAVFRNWPTDRDSVGQDWRLWCERGYLDFVCPMDYTTSEVQFENWGRNQREWAGTTRCYPGIGAWVMTPDRVIGQIEATRRLGTGGFVVFNYDSRAAGELVPLLGQGITRKTE